MKKEWIIVMLVLLLGFCIYLIAVKKINEDKYVGLLYQKQAEHSFLKNKIKEKDNYVNIMYSSTIHNNNKATILKSLENEHHSVFNSKKLVFFYNKEACGSCVNEVLYELKKLGMKIGYNNIVIATNSIYENNIKQIGDGFDHYFINTFYLEAEKLEEPMLFITDRVLDINLLYMPQLYPEFKQTYFTEIIPKYFENL